MPLTPKFGHVLVSRDDAAAVSPGGIVLPDVAKTADNRGTVVAVSAAWFDRAGVKREPQLAVGERILFKKYAGVDVKDGDAEYVLLTEDDVLAATS